MAYWCEISAYRPDSRTRWYLGCHHTDSPERAMAWLRVQARRLAGALDPRPGEGPFPAAALRFAGGEGPGAGEVFREWLGDRLYQRVQLKALYCGERVSANVLAHDDHPAPVLYSLTCTPAPAAIGPAPRLGPIQRGRDPEGTRPPGTP